MTFDDYTSQLAAKKLSEVKAKILRKLWESGNDFPRNWVSSSSLLEITQQKYFDRRTRELRDELGCDIETKHIYGEHHYRLNSPEVKNSNPRQYLTEAEKRRLFDNANYTCAICGKKTESGVRGLQADHKVPLIRGGTKDIDNWQAVCNDCNVSKRRACQNCEEDCQTCSWAFPNILGISISVRFSADEIELLKSITHDIPSFLHNLAKEHLKSDH